MSYVEPSSTGFVDFENRPIAQIVNARAILTDNTQWVDIVDIEGRHGVCDYLYVYWESGYKSDLKIWVDGNLIVDKNKDDYRVSDFVNKNNSSYITHKQLVFKESFKVSATGNAAGSAPAIVNVRLF